MNKMKGIIYDLDGVIVDTAQYHYLGWKKLADHIHVEFDEKKNEKLKGLSRRDSLLAMLGRVPDEEQIKKWCEMKNRFYLEFIRKLDVSVILPGAADFLETVRKNGSWKQALASSSRNARLILKKLGIERFFDAVVDGTEVERAKPDPRIFLKAALKLQLQPDQVVVVEDAESGIRAAQAAGMKTIGIGRPDLLSRANLVVKDLSCISLATLEGLFR
ncbi:MAG: beta-phosphoglucomutase [bacterium]|nr:beta-phosphoglucomutase [bacterium]